MTSFDKLSQHEILIRQFEFRNNQDDFNYLIRISRDVLNVFQGRKEISDRVEVIAAKLLETEPFTGTNKKDVTTLKAFDDYKCFLLAEIKAAKKQCGEEVVEL
jgi:hypothetical protein